MNGWVLVRGTVSSAVAEGVDVAWASIARSLQKRLRVVAGAVCVAVQAGPYCAYVRMGGVGEAEVERHRRA